MFTLIAAAGAALAGCTGELATHAPGERDAGAAFDAGGRDAGAGFDAGPDYDADLPDAAIVLPDAGGGDVDAGVEVRIDAGPCAGGSLAASLTAVMAPDVHPGGELFAEPTDAGGAVLAWVAGGSVHVRRVDGTGASAGADIVVTSSELHGLAVAPDAYAVLVARAPDLLALVVVGLDGSMIADRTLIGGVPHAVVDNEWFGPLIRHGRLTWTGTTWAAYYPLQRHWSDGIEHYGDQLRTLMRDGTPVSTLWGWGCSHSIDTRLTSNAVGLGPVCTSDCYPGKGVYFMHDTLVYTDPSGDCSGGVDTHLGGVAPVAGGFWVGFSTPAARASRDVALVHVSDAHAVGTVQWLSSAAGAEDDVHVAPAPDGGAIVAWTEGGMGRLVRVSAAGAMMGAAETIDASLVTGASDFFAWPGGDVGWAVPGATARLVRLRASCP